MVCQEPSGTTYLSRVDDIFWQEHPTKPDRPDTWKDFDIDCYVQDGDVISCGDELITVLGTPGHTPGCLSYIFPVYDNGLERIAYSAKRLAYMPNIYVIGQDGFARCCDMFEAMGRQALGQTE